MPPVILYLLKLALLLMKEAFLVMELALRCFRASSNGTIGNAARQKCVCRIHG